MRHFLFFALLFTVQCYLEKLARWDGGAILGRDSERAAPALGNSSKTGSIFFRTALPLTNEGFPGENRVEILFGCIWG